MNNDDIFRQALLRQNNRASDMKMPNDMEQRVVKRIKSKSNATRRLYFISVSAIAVSVLILIGFSLSVNDGEAEMQEPIMVQHIGRGDSMEKVEEKEPMPKVAQETSVVAQNVNVRQTDNTVNLSAKEAEATSFSVSADKLNDYIARLEAELEAVDDSVREAHIEKLIAADFRLQQLVNRIVKGEVDQAMNEFKKDSTANYINF
jgi:hypothetical protein